MDILCCNYVRSSNAFEESLQDNTVARWNLDDLRLMSDDSSRTSLLQCRKVTGCGHRSVL
jgi:hypothetical protein